MPQGTSKSEIVGDALRDKRADFEAFVRNRVRRDEVDDVLQIAALRAVERAESLDDPARVVAWLYRLHRNVIIDVGRKHASERRVVDGSVEVPDEPSPPLADTCGCSLSLAREVGSNYASILSLVDVGGLKLGEAARRLGISANNATVRLHRARKALRKKMLEHCGVSSLRECFDCRCVHDGCCGA